MCLGGKAEGWLGMWEFSHIGEAGITERLEEQERRTIYYTIA